MNHHYLRNALPTDRGRYLNWMKDEELRRSSFGLEQDDYENDRAWFEALMKDEETDKLVEALDHAFTAAEKEFGVEE